MKKMLFLVTMAAFLSCANLFSQENTTIESAFQKVNATLLANQLDDEVTFINGTTNDSYSKAEFIKILNQFLRLNSPKSFDLIHEGARGDSRFVIYALTSARANYRIHIFFKKINNQYLINQVRIEQSNE
ncbi:MAG: DUF4783 domain-containing protein [Bacteroidales bacterium]|nr:DUF4783 domain-containing protein [Bacteroidales bacterium]